MRDCFDVPAGLNLNRHVNIALAATNTFPGFSKKKSWKSLLKFFENSGEKHSLLLVTWFFCRYVWLVTWMVECACVSITSQGRPGRWATPGVCAKQDSTFHYPQPHVSHNSGRSEVIASCPYNVHVRCTIRHYAYHPCSKMYRRRYKSWWNTVEAINYSNGSKI